MKFTRTKIIASIGPNTRSFKSISQLHKAGMNVVRVNMSHASHDDLKETIKIVKKVNKLQHQRYGPLGVLLDTQGPEIRTGESDEKLDLKVGEVINLTVRDNKDVETSSIQVNYSGIISSVKKGSKITIDNGLINFKVLSKDKFSLRCRVVDGGELGSKRHVNLPGIETGLPSLTEKDRRDSLVGIECKHDFFALSFVRDADSIDLFRSFLKDNGSDAQVIAKLEDQKGVQNLKEIIQAADALMVARGDLGIECPFEELPIIQRKAVGSCQAAGKPVIVATHMLESMIESPVRTSAEISEVANAGNEGSDCIMLSGETTTGKFPIDCVKILTRIASRMEGEIQPGLTEELKLFRPKAKMLRSAAMLSMRMENSAVLVFTRSGDLAAKLGALRPNGSPLFAFTDVEGLHRRLRLIWGIEPFLMDFSEDPEITIQNAINSLKKENWIEPGDQLVTVTNAFAHQKVVESIQLREIDKDA